MSKPTLDATPPLFRFFRTVETFREHDPEASLILLQVFTIIANNPDHTLTMSDIARTLGIKQASMTHNVARLGSGGKDGPRLGGKHLGLVETKPDPRDGRRSTLALTVRGRNLLTLMGRALEGRD